MFCNEICEILKNTLFYRTPLVATSKTSALAADLLHIRIGNFDWCKCGHCKNEVREIDCFCCREVDTMLAASAKILECEGSISPSSFCWQLPDSYAHVLTNRWVFLFVPGIAERNEHPGRIYGFIFLFLVLISWNEEGRWVRDFLLLPQRFESFTSDLQRVRARWRNLIFVVLVGD